MTGKYESADPDNTGAVMRFRELIEQLRSACSEEPTCFADPDELIMAVFALYDEARQCEDAARPEALLNELRTLYRNDPSAEIVRQVFAGILAMKVFVLHAKELHLTPGIDELRALQQDHPQDESVRIMLVSTLWFAYTNADNAAPEALLDELRALQKAGTVSNSPQARQTFVALLGKSYSQLKDTDPQEAFELILNELRALYKAFPNERPTQEHYASALYNAFAHGMKAGAQNNCEELVAELRNLCSAHGHASSTIDDTFARALEDAHRHAIQSGDFKRVDALLNEFRRVQRKCHHEASIAGRLAVTLLNDLLAAREHNLASRFNSRLKELRKLYVRHRDSADVRESYATALFNAIGQLIASGDLLRCERLHHEIRFMHKEHPDDSVVRSCYASALLNASIVARVAGKPARIDEFVCELRALAAEVQADDAVREALVEALASALTEASIRRDWSRCSSLLEELHHLRKKPFKEAHVYENLAEGFSYALQNAFEGGNLELREQLLEQLRGLYRCHRELPGVRAGFAWGLSSTLYGVKDEGAVHRRAGLLDEVRAMHQDYPNDEEIRNALAATLAPLAYDFHEEEDFAGRDEALKELRDLYEANPGEHMRQCWTQALASLIPEIEKAGEMDTSAALREELETLKRTERLSSEG